MSSIGSSRRISQATNTIPMAVPAAKLTSDAVEVQPRSGAWMMAYTSELIAAMDRTAPTGSSFVACGSRESGTRCIAPTKAATSSGTLIQNTDDHEKLRINAPPTIGPRAMPAPLAAVQTAIALARSRGSPNTLTRIDSVVGMINAPPRPITQRPTMRAVVEPAVAATTEPARNVARPASSACRRPKRSPMLPAVRSSPANTMVYDGDDPLQLGRAGAEIADEPGHGDVDDGVVDGGDEQREHEHAEDPPAIGVAGVGFAGGLGDRDGRAW